MTNYSHTRLSTFEKCRLAYKYKYIDKIKSHFVTADAFLGSRVHDTLYILHKNENLGRRLTLEEFLEFFNNDWMAKWDENVHVVLDGLQQEHFKARGEQYIKDYYDDFRKGAWGKEYLVSIEENRFLDLPDGNKFSVKIDRLGCKGDSYIVNDYKTTTSLMSQKDGMADRQLGMYALWVHLNHPDAVKVVERWHLLHFNKVLDVVHDRDALNGIMTGVIDLIAEIEDCVDFPAKRTHLCNYCEFQKICPEFSFERPQSIAPQDVVNLGKDLVELKSFKKDIENKISIAEKAIIEYYRASGVGNIVTDSHIISILEEQTIRLPKNYSIFLHENKLLEKYGQVHFMKVKKAVLSGQAEQIIADSVERVVENRLRIKPLDSRINENSNDEGN